MPATRVLNRQRILLELANQSGSDFSLRRLTLLAFVVAHETHERGGDSFYAFVPHRDGPVSFTLTHEVRKLADNDLINLEDEHGVLSLSNRASPGLPPRSRDDVRWAVRRLADVSTDALAKRITKRYPKYRHMPRRMPQEHPSALYTKGYEGQSVERFLGDLLAAGVRRIIDVRRTPASRRFGFHRSTLQRLAQEIDLSYHHFPNVGIPSSERKDVKTEADYRALLNRYESFILPAETENVNEIAELTSREPSVLMCAEKDANLCHRSRLARAVSSTNGLEVAHI